MPTPHPPDPHEMQRAGTTASGAEEWRCTACSRRLLLRPPPDYARLVLDRGDETVGHRGAAPGLRITAAARPLPPAPHARERAWLAGHGIAWDADGEA